MSDPVRRRRPSAPRRQVALLDYALGALARRRGRNLAIVVGLAFTTGLFASVLFLTSALTREYTRSIDAAPDVTVQRVVAGRPALIPESEGADLASLRGVRAVHGRVWGYLFLPSIGANVTVIGARGLDAPAGAIDLSVDGVPTASLLPGGRRPRATNEALLGARLAANLGVWTGDRVALPTPSHGFETLVVTGVFTSESAVHTADVALVSEHTARVLLGVPDGLATDLAISLRNPNERSVVARRAALLPGARVLERDGLRRAYALTFGARAGVLAAALLPTLAALLLLAWDRLTGLSAAERREIGILKTIGWETRDVLTARMWESGLVAAAGAALGLIGAYAHVFWFDAAGLSGVIFGWSALYPTLALVPSVGLGQVGAVAGLVIVPFVAISVVPAWRAATLDPDQALRAAA